MRIDKKKVFFAKVIFCKGEQKFFFAKFCFPATLFNLETARICKNVMKNDSKRIAKE